MANTQDITVNLQRDGERMRFRLEWKKSVYHNPIDGSEVKAQWKTYRPSGPPREDIPTYPHIKLSHTVFLVEPPPGHSSVEELVAYTQRIIKILADNIPVTPIPLPNSREVGRQVIIEIEIPKCEGWLKMAVQPSMDGLSLQQVLPQIAQLQQPQTRSRIKFQMMISVWGFQETSTEFS